jgi:4-hydroxybenzoate polyprenyltransferase
MAKGLAVFSDLGLLGKALLGCGLWAVCLNGGTLAFNSAMDRDEGDIGFLNNPPPLPPRLGLFGFGVMLGGGLGSLALGFPYLSIYVFSVFMSWLYSAPPARLKARGGWDVAINMLGYGALTALAGWLAVADPPRGADWMIFAGFAFLFAAVYPMTQFYQKEEDLRKAARTLVLVLGDTHSMLFIHLSLACATASWLIAALGRQIALVNPLSPLGWSCLAFQAVLWFLFAAHWWITFPRYPHQKGLYRAMALWAVSNIALVISFSG